MLRTGNTNKLLVYQVREFMTTAHILPIKTEEESTIKLTKPSRLPNSPFKTWSSLTPLFTMYFSHTKVGQRWESHWPQPLSKSGR